MRLYRRKATATQDPTMRMMFSSAVTEQKDQIEYFGAQRDFLLKQTAAADVKQMLTVIAV